MNRASAALICALLGSDLVPIAALAAIIEVPTDYPTIQAAIDNANPGDEVVVLPGTYIENLSIVFRNSLSIYSQGGPDVTRLDGSYSRPAFRVQNSTMIRVAGFTIERGLIGGEIRGSGQVVIEENRIERNVSPTDGGGLFIVHSSVVVANNIIIDNASNYGLSLDGGGIYLYNSTGSVRANRIQGNRGHEGGGVIINQTANLILSQNLILENDATLYGGGVYVNVGVHADIISNTIVANSALSSGGGLWYTQFSSPFVSKNIIATNSAFEGGGVHAFLPGASPTFSCNDVWSNTGGNYGGSVVDPTGTNGNLSLDPLFCGVIQHDYTIDETSPCAPENSPAGCALIGAFEIGCGVTAVDATTWGSVKSTFAASKRVVIKGEAQSRSPLTKTQ